MPIDPSIALSIKPMQITSQEDYLKDIYAQQNAQQTNQLNRMKMDEYSRGVAQDEAIRNDLAKAKTSEDVVNTLTKYGKTKEASDYAYRTAETGKVGAEVKNLGYVGDKTQLESAHKRLDIMGQAFGYVRNNPTPQAAGMALKHLRDSGVIDDAKANELWQQVMADPTKIKDMADMAFTSTLQAKDQLPKFSSQNLGGTVREIGVNPITGVTTVAPGSEAKVTATPGELLTKDTAIRGQNLTDAREKQRLANEQNPNVVAHQQVAEDGTVTNFNKFGQVIGTVKGVGKPSAQFTKTKEQTKKLNTDLNLAITELDNATKDGGLIDQSTGSGLGKAANAVRGFMTGGASEGAIAGAKLAPIADLALKMVPRFEGPQSDKDTQSYKEAAGQLADTSIPNEIRKQAGRTVLRLMKARKDQFTSQDLLQGGASPTGGGVDSSNPLLN